MSEDGSPSLVGNLRARITYLEKERIELRQEVQRMEKDAKTREAIIRALETDNSRLLKDIKDLRDKIGELTYDLGVVKRKESISFRPKDSPLPQLPSEQTDDSRPLQLAPMEEEESGSGYAKIGVNVKRVPTDSGSEEESPPVPSNPGRKRTLTMDDIHIKVETSKESVQGHRSRVATVGNLDILGKWKHSRGASVGNLTSFHPINVPRKVSKNIRDQGRNYPIAPYMAEKIHQKIEEELGKKYGGLNRATQAAITIQRWYKQVCLKRHWKMLQGMAAHQPKKLRQRTRSMRQSFRPRRYTTSAKPEQEREMKKCVSILDEFPEYKSIAEKVSTPRQRRHKHSVHSNEESPKTAPSKPSHEELVSVEFQEDTQEKPWRKRTMKKMVIQSSFSDEGGLRDSESLSPGGDSGFSTNSPTPLEEGLSIITQSRLDKISEFRVCDRQNYLKGERESATTMRRKINIGVNYFNRKPWKGLVYLVQRRVLEDSPSKVATFFMTRVDLCREKVGEFLGDIQSEFSNAVLEEMVSLMNFRNKTVDEALRVFQANFFMPGEAQKIEKIVEVFANGYYDVNSGPDDELFDSSDAIFVLSYAIMMLNTDLHNPNVRRHLTRDEWLGMNKGVNGGKDFPAEFLIGIYDRIQQSPFMPARDHTHHVDSIEKSVTGCPKIVLSHRRLLFKCKVVELEGDGHKTRPRFLFVFNDMLLVTKPRNRDYQFKATMPLVGARIVKFDSMSTAHKYGVDICSTVESSHHFMCCCDEEAMRTKLVKHLDDAVAELTEMERERILAGEQSAMKGSVRLSPSNLSAIEAPEFSSSESGDYNQDTTGMMRSGSVPDAIFALNESVNSPPPPIKDHSDIKPLPLVGSLDNLDTLNLVNSLPVSNRTDETDRRPHSMSVGESNLINTKEELHLSVSLDPIHHQERSKSWDRRQKERKTPRQSSPTPAPTYSPSKFKFWKKKPKPGSPTSTLNSHS